MNFDRGKEIFSYLNLSIFRIENIQGDSFQIVWLCLDGESLGRKFPFMPKPQPEALSADEARVEALRVVAEDRFPYLASMEGDQPRLRPVSPVRTEGFIVYVANLRSYGKTAEIAANPKVELCYLDEGHDQVRITAVAGVLDDRETLESIWKENPLLRQYLGSIDNPELIVYKMKPARVRFMREWALEYHEVKI